MTTGQFYMTTRVKSIKFFNTRCTKIVAFEYFISADIKGFGISKKRITTIYYKLIKVSSEKD